MAKNSKAKWVIVAIMVSGVIAATITTFVWAQADIKAVDIKADGIETKQVELKEEGCLPARANDKAIGKIEIHLTNIDTRLDTLNTQQTAGFKAVMEKLNEK